MAPTRARPTTLLGAVGVAVVGGLLAWLPWMGWGMLAGGEFAPWQVLGSGLTFVIVAALLGWSRHVAVAALLLPLVYTAAWTWWASDDPSGLFLVGAVMLLVGTVVAATVVASLGAAASALAARRGRPGRGPAATA